jgi:hypothetical protein
MTPKAALKKVCKGIQQRLEEDINNHETMGGINLTSLVDNKLRVRKESNTTKKSTQWHELLRMFK